MSYYVLLEDFPYYEDLTEIVENATGGVITRHIHSVMTFGGEHIGDVGWFLDEIERLKNKCDKAKKSGGSWNAKSV